MSSYVRNSKYFAGVINPKAARILFIGFALLVPIMLSIILVFVADPTTTPEQPSAEKVVEGLGQVFGSPIDFFIVWLLLFTTFLIGMLFFVNKKYHYVSLLLILLFMSVVNFYVIATTLSPTGTISFESGTLLAFVLIVFGFAVIPTLVPFLLGGGFIFMLSSIFKQPSIRQESFSADWNANYAKFGVRIWRPKLFFFSLYASVVLFIMAWLVPSTEGNTTYMAISGVLLVTMFWMLFLVIIQLTFNITQGGFRTNAFSIRKHDKKSRTSKRSKSSIRNIRKPR